MEQTENTQVKKEIFEAILRKDLHAADSLRKTHQVGDNSVKNIVEKAFRELLRTKEVPFAIIVCEHFHLSMERRAEAVSTQFRLFNNDKQFDEAIEWGLKYKIPKNEIHNVAVKAFNKSLDEKDVEKALEQRRKYEIPDQLITGTGLQWFNMYFKQRDYVRALQLGYDFNVSRKRTLTAGIRGFYLLLRKGEIQKFVEFEKKYNILGDKEIESIDENDMILFTKVFTTNVVKDLLEQSKAAELSDLIDSLQILDKRHNNPLLAMMLKKVADEVAIVHCDIMDNGNYSEAHRLVESFHLLTEDISFEARVQFIESAENAHHKLLKEDRLKEAKIIKDHYGLFDKNLITDSIENVIKIVSECLKNVLEKGEVENAGFLLQEYKLPIDVVRETGGYAIITLLQARKFIEAFETIKLLKIPVRANPIFNAEATSCFNEAFENKQMELASNIGFYFKIKDKRVVLAAFSLWKKNLNNGNFSAALEHRKLHKIPKKLTTPVIKEKYQKLMKDGQTEQAIHLRNQYDYKLGIIEWIVEFIKRMLK